MNVKKLAAAGVGAAMFLATAVPVFASVNIWNGAEVLNEILTAANTGGNVITGGVVDGGSIDTGNAGAATEVTNVVNSNDVNHWGWDCDCNDVNIENGAGVLNGVGTLANSGENTIAADVVLGGEIGTGHAGSASVVTNVVNTNLVDSLGWWPEP